VIPTVLHSDAQGTEATGAATLFTHHYAKGSPNNKEALDRFSGSGVLIRDPDVYFAMTRHAQEDAFTLDLTLRCLPQVEPFVVRWEYPLFELAPDLNHEELRKATESGDSLSSSRFQARETRGQGPQETLTRSCYGPSHEVTRSGYPGDGDRLVDYLALKLAKPNCCGKIGLF
jgi:hypothetical protein